MEQQYNISSNEVDIMTQMQQFQQNYYSQNTRNTFFKKSQKTECAQQLSQTFDLQTLLTRSIFQLQNTHYVYFDYTIFKLYANPNIYDQIVQYILQLLSSIIRVHGKYSIHLNLDSFTISAAERYKNLIQLYNKYCLEGTDFSYTDQLEKLYLYNPPNVLDTIFILLKPFIEPVVVQKVIVIPKKESGDAL